MLKLTSTQSALLRYWLPPFVAGLLVWVFFLLLSTPMSRATGLALAMVGIAGALRRFGAAIAVLGALTLAVSPAMLAQLGGGIGEPATIVLAAGAGIGVAILATLLLSRQPYLALALAVAVFVALFVTQLGTPRSLRLTVFAMSWLVFLLVDMLLLTNPHPAEAPPILRAGESSPPRARAYHTWGILLVLGAGILNDPVMSLLIPAVALALVFTNTRLPWFYWLLFGGLAVFGGARLLNDYVIAHPEWFVAAQWRNAARWIIVLRIVIAQFSVIGILLAVLGLARLARWYTPLGVTSMVAFAAYWCFGLIYVGPNRNVLLLPLFILQVLWMSYAAFTLGEWVSKASGHAQLRWLVWAGLALLIGIWGWTVNSI